MVLVGGGMALAGWSNGRLGRLRVFYAPGSYADEYHIAGFFHLDVSSDGFKSNTTSFLLVCSGPDSSTWPSMFGQAKSMAAAASNLKCYDKDACTTDVCVKGVCSFPATPEGGSFSGMYSGVAVEKCIAGQCVTKF